MQTVPARVFVFIDLDSARRIKRPSWLPDAEQKIDWRIRKNFVLDVFSELQDRICKLLPKLIHQTRAQVVSTRIYHGWHQGLTPTSDYKLWAEAKNSFVHYKTNNLVYLPDISFGNELLCGGIRGPLYDTLRKGENGEYRQKMVDTALVADLLQLARSESASFAKGRQPNVLALLLADDDDLIPGAIAAESWGMPIRIARITRASESSALNLKNMVERL